MSKISVVVVDDHKLLLDAIANLVHSFDDFEVIYTCSNGQELLDKLEATVAKPDIILMDIQMPVLNGIEATHEVNKKYPKIHVLALSVEDDEQTIIKMLKAGAKGYLLKDIEKNILEIALKEVHLHGYYYTREVSNILVGSLNNKDTPEIALKSRELEFIKHACTELTYREIAEKMFLSPKTIDGYRDKLFQKLHIKNRIGLVLYAVKKRLIEL